MNRRDDSGAAGQPRGVLPAVMHYGRQLMSCTCARMYRIADYKRQAMYFFKM